MMYKTMWAKHTLGVAGSVENAVLKGESVKVFETFQDANGVWCFNIENERGEKYHVACCHLRKTSPDGTPPPQEALEATGGISAKGKR